LWEFQRFWPVLPIPVECPSANPIAGDFSSVAADRWLLGSLQDRLVLKENKTKKAEAFSVSA
jgi:hypothetical protein